MTEKFVYTALRVQQQPDAPEFYLAAVSAEDLTEWCDVPRSKSDFMAGYQRALSKRHEQIAEYFKESPSNISPGAIIVALDSDHVSVLPADDGSTHVALEISPDSRDFVTRLQELFGTLTARLSDDELVSAEIHFSAPDEYDEEDEDASEEQTRPVSYLSVLAAELRQAIEDFSSLDEERQDAIIDYIDGTSKPGLIIDGQHRVFGAKAVSSHPIMLPVVLIPGLAHSEQVFQFYVLNSTAKPLKKTELRRIISTSLTDEEIEELYERFDQAGVEAEESRWTFQMNMRDDSPFRGLIDFGFGRAGEVVPENVADQLIRRFTRIKSNQYKNLLTPISNEWKEPDYRLERFFDLWSAIAEAEEFSELWSGSVALAHGDPPVQAQLFRKVSLITLQEFVLDKLNEIVMYQKKKGSALADRDRLRENVSTILGNLKTEFFEREWKLKQQDTTEGRKEFRSEMDKVYAASGKVDGRARLFRGQD